MIVLFGSRPNSSGRMRTVSRKTARFSIAGARASAPRARRYITRFPLRMITKHLGYGYQNLNLPRLPRMGGRKQFGPCTIYCQLPPASTNLTKAADTEYAQLAVHYSAGPFLIPVMGYLTLFIFTLLHARVRFEGNQKKKVQERRTHGAMPPPVTSILTNGKYLCSVYYITTSLSDNARLGSRRLRRFSHNLRRKGRCERLGSPFRTVAMASLARYCMRETDVHCVCRMRVFGVLYSGMITGVRGIVLCTCAQGLLFLSTALR